MFGQTLIENLFINFSHARKNIFGFFFLPVHISHAFFAGSKSFFIWRWLMHYTLKRRDPVCSVRINMGARKCTRPAQPEAWCVQGTGEPEHINQVKKVSGFKWVLCNAENISTVSGPCISIRDVNIVQIGSGCHTAWGDSKLTGNLSRWDHSHGCTSGDYPGCIS